MFQTLYTKWSVQPIPNQPNKCAVSFELKFLFKSALYNSVSKSFGPTIANIMIKAFISRANALSKKNL